MKKGIHPQFYPEAKIKCDCGAEYTVGSTVKAMQVEICGRCHPFYTGQQKLVDTAGRIDKFKERLIKAKTQIASSSDPSKRRNFKSKVKDF